MEEVVWGELVVFLDMTVQYFHLLISIMKSTEKGNYQKRSFISSCGCALLSVELME